MAAAIPIAVLTNVFAMIVVFVFKGRLKVIGITLMIIAVITGISIGAFGIVGFGMFLAAGIVALRYKNKQISAVNA